jgi:hypothetical protein
VSLFVSLLAASVAAGLRVQCVSKVSGRPQAYRPVNETKKKRPRSEVVRIDPLLWPVVMVLLR